MRAAYLKCHSYLNFLCVTVLFTGAPLLFPHSAYYYKSFNVSTDLAYYKYAAVYTPSGCGQTVPIVTCILPKQLDADADAPYWLWSTGEKTQSITATSGGVYWWETGDMSQNKVVNGDFTSGTTGFSSSYSYKNPSGGTANGNTLQDEGTFTVNDNPHAVHLGFDPITDHTANTTGARNMMVINGSKNADVTVWREFIDVLPNTKYVFSIWCTSVNSQSPGQLNFSIGNTQFPVFNLSSQTGLWQNFTTTWDSGAGGTIRIAIVNQNTAPSGNDFAIDDIVFAPVCRKYINLIYDSTPLKPTITPQ